MKKLIKLGIILTVFISVIFTASAIAYADDSKDFKPADAGDVMVSLGAKDINTSATSTSYTIKWKDPKVKKGYVVDGWHLVFWDDDNNEWFFYKDLSAKTRSYTLNELKDGIYTHGSFTVKLYLVCDLKETATGDVTQYLFDQKPLYVFTKYSKSNFSLMGNGTLYQVDYTGSYSDGTEVEVRTLSGSLVKRCDINEFIKAPKNKIYKYRIRPYIIDEETGEKVNGFWSSYRYFGNCTTTIYYGTSNGCTVKLKGIKGVSKYKIYVSTSSEYLGKYTTSYSPKAGKTSSYKLNKIGKSKMKKYNTYYVNVVPVINGNESDIYATVNFYNRY